MQFGEAKLGRIFVLRLHDGDHLPYILEKFASDHKIRSAICFLLGGAKGKSQIIVGPKEDLSPPEAMIRLLRGVHEVFAVGTIFSDEKEKPKLHMHASFGRGDQAITGCVRLGIEVWRIGEVILLEIIGAKAYRVRDEKTGFELLELK